MNIFGKGKTRTMMTMDELLSEATRIREEAKKTIYWKLNIEALLESNHECFVGPISYEDIEACFNFILDQYDPNILIRDGILSERDYKIYVENSEDGNPFFSLIELDEEKNVKDVILWETDDRELVGEFLSKKYKWRE
jgi:hypothetical protein